jgi:hypothetical protein
LIDLSKIAKAEMSQMSTSIRIFPGWSSFLGTSKNNWGMEITMPSWLDEVHNTKSGRVFYFGSGPSLVTQLPLLEAMVDEETWTVNRLSKWKELPFTPMHHCIAEPGPVLRWGQTINNLYAFPGAVNHIAVHWNSVTAPNWLWCPKAPDDIQMRWEGFYGLGNTLPPLPTGWASPLTTAQLGAWMGYTEFYFLGIDTTQMGQAWDAEQGRTTYPRNIRSILECFDRARTDIEQAGRKVYDCTPEGRINQEGVLEYVELGDVLGA